MLKALSNNRLVKHAAFSKIMFQYNEKLKADGRVNNKKFFEDIVSKEIPSYSIQAWYQFLKRFKTEAGIIQPTIVDHPQSIQKTDSLTPVSQTMLSTKEASSKAIALALNIGMDRLQQLIENPQLMTAKDAIDLVFKAMKAQDSRIHAIGKIREDNREQEKFDRAFDGANF